MNNYQKGVFENSVSEHVTQLVRKLKFFHFTDVRNILSISELGLLSVEELRRIGVTPIKFDHSRHDQQFAPEGPICVSVGHPSPGLLRASNMERQFVILELDANFYFEAPRVIVCPTNAASDEISSVLLDVDLNEFNVRPTSNSVLYNPNSILGFFVNPFPIKWNSGAEGDHERDQSKASKLFPNDPQSELLLSPRIAPSHISKVICRSDAVVNIVNQLAPELADKCSVNERLFLPRPDLKNWREKVIDARRIVRILETDLKLPKLTR